MPDPTPPEPQEAPPPPGPIRLSPLWLVFAALALALPLGALLATRAAPAPLPVLAEVPAFTLTDQTGRPWGRAELTGHVTIADFIFTNCPVACPRLTSIMKGLQQRLTPAERAGALRLLSISVDPERDTPAAMAAYMQKHGADPAVWTFLTGDESAVERAVVHGFRVAMSKEPLVSPDAGSAEEVRERAFEILHGERFVLVDARGQLRGYYDVGAPEGVEALLRDARRLVGGER